MIRLSPSQLDDIHAQAEAAYPYECCGLLAGYRDGDGNIIVTQVVSSPNTWVDRQAETGKDRFEVDPQVRFDLMRAIKSANEEIVGHYHSHPDHPAKPSETDLDMAFEPELIWLITSVENRTVTATRAWQLNRETQDTVEVRLITVP
ncbi:MAG: M67 family metallopeptidase [Magnetovibrio sp.]|nr:M67 family metallopeptidase [Magnetovibrio sp.]